MPVVMTFISVALLSGVEKIPISRITVRYRKKPENLGTTVKLEFKRCFSRKLKMLPYACVCANMETAKNSYTSLMISRM